MILRGVFYFLLWCCFFKKKTVCLIYQFNNKITTMKTSSYYRIIAKNRFGHSTVFAADNNLIDMIRVCLLACWFYRWINLKVTMITEKQMEPWMEILHREKTPVIRNYAEEKYRVYVSINRADADRFAAFVGAQSIFSRTDGAFDILVLSTRSY